MITFSKKMPSLKNINPLGLFHDSFFLEKLINLAKNLE